MYGRDDRNIYYDEQGFDNNESLRRSTPVNNFKPEPGFYQVIKDKDGNYSIELEGPEKKVPSKIYGKTGERVLRYWKKFVKSESTIGILLVGASGGGKSMESDLLCNIAIMKGKLPVLNITGFDVTEQTIQFLEHYDDVVLYFDEFSKHVKYHIQDLLLSLLTNTNKRYLVLMTENDINTISAYLRSRPGRAWYRKIFDKLELDVVEDYLEQFPNIKPVFKEELLSKYKSAMAFTFDHLKALVDEHADYPDETIDEMLELLNIDVFTKAKKYYLTKLEELVENSEDEYKEIGYTDIELEPYQVEQDRYTISIFTKLEELTPEQPVDTPSPFPMYGFGGRGGPSRGEEIKFNINNVIERDGATLVFKSGKYRFTLIKMELGDSLNKSSNVKKW